MQKNDFKVKLGSNWTTAPSEEFNVIKLEKKNNENWVFYKNKKTKQEYSCLEEAFISRFRLNINYRYGE